MRPLLSLLALPFLFTTAACDEAGNDPIITPGPTDTFELVYVSGHLGNYWDCPQDALSSTSEAAGAPEPVSSEAADMAACEGEDCAPMILNCEHAEVTLRIRNIGEDSLNGLTLASIRLVGPNGADTFESSLVELVRTDGKELSDAIAADSEIDVVVRFRGLTNDAYQQLSASRNGDAFAPTSGITVEFDFETPNASDTLKTPSLTMLPSVAT